jgi:hypothetical protein
MFVTMLLWIETLWIEALWIEALVFLPGVFFRGCGPDLPESLFAQAVPRPHRLETWLIEVRFLRFCQRYTTLLPTNWIRLGNIPQVIVGPNGDEHPLSGYPWPLD